MNYVELSVPATPDSLSLIRLTAGSIATRLDVTLDELEDLQLAVDELCLVLLGDTTPDDGRLRLRIEWETDVVAVRCELLSAVHPGGGSATGLGPASLSRQILDALVDEHGADVEDGVPTAWLRKRRKSTLSTS